VATTHGAGYKTGPGRAFDTQLAGLAARQHGVFTLGQACALGLSESAVRRRAQSARLFRIHRGVYALVARRLLSREGRWLAAVLACGDQAALSHRSAAHLHELRATTRAGIDVIVAGTMPHRHPGIDLHRSVNVAPNDVTTIRGIPVTTIDRTLLDLAAVVGRHQLARALHQADLLRLLDVSSIARQLERNPHAPGASTLRAELDLPTELNDSPLEDRFLAAWRASGGPEPERRPYIDPGDGGVLLRPDFVWRDAKVAVETDGRETHDTRAAFEEDRLRDQRLTAAGWIVIRVTDRQLTDEPGRIVRLVQTLIVSRR
jgi:predicted transcriptional regulator of viral defense system